ncbi:hypothetical protein CBS101457_001764 [Exobasidium rhododendri]|nr:hypothetical protein CBS101457_001764 [Exobasidium rhododendri]
MDNDTDADSDGTSELCETSSESESAEIERNESTRNRKDHCRLECLLSRSEELFPKSQLLFSAHLQLDTLSAETKWSLVLKALKDIGPASRKGSKGDVKSYRRHALRSPFPQNVWTASVERLQARLDGTFADLYDNARIRLHSDSLAASEKRAFNACLQIWKQAIRGGTDVCDYRSSAHHLTTSLEASVLCRSDDALNLVLCFCGTSIDPKKLQEDLIVVAGLEKDDKRWKSLEICANTSAQAKGALQVVLSQSTSFQSLIVLRHGRSSVVAPKDSGKTIEFPPRIALSDTLKRCDNTFESDDCMQVFRHADYLSALERMLRKGHLDRCFEQPAKMPTLTSLASFVVRRSGLDTISLPSHLQESVKTATTCSSCERIMTSQRISTLQGHSVEFRKQAELAGFGLHSAGVDEAIMSFSARRPYLPPLSEEIEIQTVHGVTALPTSSSQARYDRTMRDTPLSARDRNEQGICIHIGGSNLLPYEDSIGKEWQWQFCAFCIASHLNILPAEYCRCFLCAYRRRSDRIMSLGVNRTLQDGTNLPLPNEAREGQSAFLDELRRKTRSMHHSSTTYHLSP